MLEQISDDRLLLKYTQLGDIDALNLLVSRYLKKVYVYFLSKLNNKNDAEDLTQNVFLKIIRKIDSGEEIKNFRDYLFRSCRNLLYDFYRKRKTNELFQSSNNPGNQHIINFQSLLNWQKSGLQQSRSLSDIETAVNDCLSKFKNETTRNILRDYVYGYPLKEIAARNGCPVSTAGSIWHRQKGKLMECVLRGLDKAT